MSTSATAESITTIRASTLFASWAVSLRQALRLSLFSHTPHRYGSIPIGHRSALILRLPVFLAPVVNTGSGCSIQALRILSSLERFVYVASRITERVVCIRSFVLFADSRLVLGRLRKYQQQQFVKSD